MQIKGHSEDFLTVLVRFKSAKKYNKSIPTQSQSGPLYVWKVQKDKANFDTKSWPLGKGSTVKFLTVEISNLMLKVGPLGKGQQ